MATEYSAKIGRVFFNAGNPPANTTMDGSGGTITNLITGEVMVL